MAIAATAKARQRFPRDRQNDYTHEMAAKRHMLFWLTHGAGLANATKEISQNPHPSSTT